MFNNLRTLLQGPEGDSLPTASHKLARHLSRLAEKKKPFLPATAMSLTWQARLSSRPVRNWLEEGRSAFLQGSSADAAPTVHNTSCEKIHI